MEKLLTFFSKNIGIYAISNDQRFKDSLTNAIISFEQLGPVLLKGKQGVVKVFSIVKMADNLPSLYSCFKVVKIC